MSFTSHPHWERVAPPRIRASSHLRPDNVLNLLFYVPVAPIGIGAGWSLKFCVLGGAAFSVTAEGLQIFSSERNPDGNDIVANVAGTAIGGLSMLLFRRRDRRVLAQV